MKEAGAPSTEEVAGGHFRDVPAPPGVVMLAPPEVARNAQSAQKEKAAPRRIVKKRGHSSEEVRVRNQMGKDSLPGLKRYCTSCPRSVHLPYGHF
jgi:hypothetical protein